MSEEPSEMEWSLFDERPRKMWVLTNAWQHGFMEAWIEEPRNQEWSRYLRVVYRRNGEGDYTPCVTEHETLDEAKNSL